MAISEEKKRFQVSLKNDVFELVENEAKQRGISKSALVSIALTEWLATKSIDKISEK